MLEKCEEVQSNIPGKGVEKKQEIENIKWNYFLKTIRLVETKIKIY